MPPFRLVLPLLALWLLPPLAAATWQPDPAHPERHNALLSGWSLTVDSARARLVSAIPPGGAEADNILLSGGHRVWLGPQAEWPVFWPPPRDWENSPAASVTLSADATELTLALPRSDPLHPALVRRYRLLPDAVLLVAEWRIDETTTNSPPRQAIHILQTRADTAVFLTPRPTGTAPLGHGLLALAVRPGTLLAAPIPAALAAPAGPCGLLRLSSSGAEEKVGVPAQPLVARFPGGHGLRLLPAEHDGAPAPDAPDPDVGLHTQAYFGAAAWAMVEVEQLSPRLRPTRSDGRVSATVKLQFLPPPPLD